MKPTKSVSLLTRVFVFVASLILFADLGSAQTTGSGSIRGQVLNVSNGRYLSNARVTVEGTTREVFTDAAGRYSLDGLPAGEAKLRVFYTGLPEQTATVNVTPGGSLTQDFNMAGAENQSGDVLKLDAFNVAAQREMDASSLAINEQRFAPNIKNVVSTDAFGDIAEGNIGDFVKFLPGVTIDYVSPDARTVSVRGLPANYTSLTINGFKMASANSSSAGRTIELEQVSLNNMSRIEIYKSRGPDVSADALGGSVNMITRSAFESANPSLNYRMFVSANGDEKSLEKTRGPLNRDSHKIKPGFDATYVMPVSKDLGFTVTLLDSNIFYPQHRTQLNWGPTTGAQVGSSLESPVLRSYQVQDGPKNNVRNSVGVTADWRVAPRDVLSFSYQWAFYNAAFGNRPVTYTLGNVQPQSFDAVNQSFFHGAAGQGSVTLGGTSFRRKYGYTHQPTLTWRHDGPVWQMDGGVSYSHASNHYHDYQDGHFESSTLTLRGNPNATTVAAPNAPTVFFDALDKGSYLYPAITVYDNTGTTPIDLAKASNYNITGAGFNPADSSDSFKTGRFNVKRDLNLRIPFSLKTGFLVQEQLRDIRKDNPGGPTFVGPDKTANTADDNASLYDVLDTPYTQGRYLFGTPQVPYVSPYKMWELYKAHPEYWTNASQATSIANLVNNSFWFRERIYAAYLMGDVRAINNRLRVVAGIRYERTEDDGAGPYNNINAARGITDPVAAANARYVARGAKVNKEYAAGYPSVDVSYSVLPNVVARFAYAKSIGRPDLGNLIPNTVAPDTTSASTVITVINAALAPTQTNSYDASLEYYFAKTGVFSVGAFAKDFSNFVGASNVPATLDLLNQLGVADAQNYANGGYTISTKFNVGDAKLTGVEFNYSQVLDYSFMPEWARRFTIFANGQQMHLTGSTLADFSNFIPSSASWGVKYGLRQLNAQLNFNYRGRQRLLAQTVAINGVNRNDLGVYEYYKPRIYIDANLEYRFRKWAGVFINARNLTNVAQDIQRYGPTSNGNTRTYRREEFGVQYTAGIKGTF